MCVCVCVCVCVCCVCVCVCACVWVYIQRCIPLSVCRKQRCMPVTASKTETAIYPCIQNNNNNTKTKTKRQQQQKQTKQIKNKHAVSLCQCLASIITLDTAPKSPRQYRTNSAVNYLRNSIISLRTAPNPPSLSNKQHHIPPSLCNTAPNPSVII